MSDINFKELSFQKGAGGKVSFTQMIKQIKEFIADESRAKYSIFLGTDSQAQENSNVDRVEFVTAVVIHRQGFGGRYFWRSLRTPNFKTLRDRIWQEVMISLRMAETLVEFLDELRQATLNFELHIDVGTNGPTKTIIQELVAVVRSSGFQVKTKPDSFAASKVADRCL